MASVITDSGAEWLSEAALAVHDETAYVVAVGDGTTSPSSTDTSLTNELYRANDDDSVCTVDVTSNVGEILGRITVSGGTEVPAGSDIAEFGLFSSGSGTMLYHEVIDNPVTVQSGDRKTFEFRLDVLSG